MTTLRYVIVKGEENWTVFRQTFGEPQGYDVDGVCAPDTRNVWLVRGGTEWFLPAAKCRKINGGTIGIVVN